MESWKGKRRKGGSDNFSKGDEKVYSGTCRFNIGLDESRWRGDRFLGRNPDLIFTREARLSLCISTLISYIRIHVLPAEYPLNGLPVQVQYLDKIVDPLQPGINRSAAYVCEIKYLGVLYSLYFALLPC